MPTMKDKIPPQDFKPSNMAVLVAFIIGGGCLFVIIAYILLVWIK